MQLVYASIRESPSQDRLWIIRRFFCKACWAIPFKMSFNFRPILRRTFAELRQNTPIPLSADLSHQQGAHQRNRKHQGPWCLALAKPNYSKLGCCIWSLFLETSESKARQHQGQFSCRILGPRQEMVALNKL